MESRTRVFSRQLERTAVFCRVRPHSGAQIDPLRNQESQYTLEERPGQEPPVPDTNSIDVSITDFIDFAVKTGPPRLTKVAQLRRRGPYTPSTDYWKPFRDELIELCARERFDTGRLTEFASSHPDTKKVGRYSAAAKGFKQFLGRRDVRWFKPPRGRWDPPGLLVRINPELGIFYRGRPWVLKVHFRDEPISRSRVELMAFLMRHQLRTNSPEGAAFGVLEVSRSKLHQPRLEHGDLMPLLLGEAASFVMMWNGLEP